MRQTAGTLNRIWLAIVGILLLAAGITLLLEAGGALHALAATAPSGSPVITGDLLAVFAPVWVVVIVLIIGVIIGVLGLLWLIAQIPRKNTAGSYRFHNHDGHDHGFTLCDPSVLAAAVESQVNTLPGVVTCSALLRGSAKAADLTLKVTANDRADVQELIHCIETSTLADLSTALEAPLQRSRVQIEISGRAQSTGTVMASTGTIIQ